jgi:hypothetical protein
MRIKVYHGAKRSNQLSWRESKRSFFASLSCCTLSLLPYIDVGGGAESACVLNSIAWTRHAARSCESKKEECMETGKKLWGFVRALSASGFVVAMAAPALAIPWDYSVCDGYNNNNATSASGAGCTEATYVGVDCWEDPNHTPPNWADGYTYARAQIKNCSGVKQIRAYAFGNLITKMNELGGTGYYAFAESLSSLNGTQLGYATDFAANDGGAYGTWQNAGAASYIRATGRVYHN